MKVLITGGAGFLGSHLAEALLRRHDEVTLLDPASDLKVRHLRENPRFRMIRESVLNRDILDGLVAWSDPVYHLAAVVGVEHYVGDPCQVLSVNINGTQDVLAAAFRHGQKVVFSSTSEIYGRNTGVPFDEDSDRVLVSTRIDRWCYSTSKAAAEHLCFAFGRMGLPVVVLRSFNAYGSVGARRQRISEQRGRPPGTRPVTGPAAGLTTPWSTWRRRLDGDHVGGMDFDHGCLSDERHREHETRDAILSEELAANARERSANDFDLHAFGEERMRIVPQRRGHQPADAVDLRR